MVVSYGGQQEPGEPVVQKSQRALWPAHLGVELEASGQPVLGSRQVQQDET